MRVESQQNEIKNIKRLSIILAAGWIFGSAVADAQTPIADVSPLRPSHQNHGWVNARHHGASGSEFTTSGTIEAGSKELTVADAGEFKVGQGVVVYGANVRVEDARIYDPGQITRHHPIENEIEIRGFDAKDTSSRTFALEIDSEQPLTFRWSNDFANNWTTGVRVTGDWQLLSDGVEVRFKTEGWKPASLVVFHVRTDLISQIEAIEGKTLTLKHAATSTAAKGDIYFAIARYPLPPVDVRIRRPDQAKRSSGNATSRTLESPEQRRSAPRSGLLLQWSPPRYAAEIAGYHVYYSTTSGANYRRLTGTPVESPFEATQDGYYVMTSVEHSGLESRAFSNEVSLNGTGPTRIVIEAEFSDFVKPFEPWFDQRTARNAYAVGILDRDLLFRDNLKSGRVATARQQLLIPKDGTYTVCARVKCRRHEESGKFRVTLGEVPAGDITVETTEWKWVRSNLKAISLRTGKVSLQFTTTHTGVLVDQFLITEDVDIPGYFMKSKTNSQGL